MCFSLPNGSGLANHAVASVMRATFPPSQLAYFPWMTKLNLAFLSNSTKVRTMMLYMSGNVSKPCSPGPAAASEFPKYPNTSGKSLVIVLTGWLVWGHCVGRGGGGGGGGLGVGLPLTHQMASSPQASHSVLPLTQ